MTRGVATTIFTILAGGGVFGQVFEVASIKPADPDFRGTNINFAPGGRFTTKGATLKNLIIFAYNVRDFQVSGGPGWMTADRYDVTAKSEKPVTNPEEIRPMVRTLLAERFKLAVHKETKDMPVYGLVVAKSGFRLKENTGGKGPNINSRPGQATGIKVPMSFLCQFLSNQLGRTVVDQTGLTGSSDFKLEWTPEANPGQRGPDAPVADPAGPSIFTAVQEQMGLKLESQRGPVEIIVIDGAEKASEN